MWEFLLQARTAQHAACGSGAHSILYHPGLPLSKGMRDCLQCSLPAELDLIDSILNDTLQILSTFITGIITALPGVKWDFSNVYKYLMAVNEGSKTLLSGAPWEDKRQWAQIWKTGNSFWAWGNTFSVWGLSNTRTGLHREILESSSVEIFKIKLDTGLGSTQQLNLPEQGLWTKESQEHPSNLNEPVIQRQKKIFCM